jgi:broad specificity phosphatase PhoE
MKFIEIRRHSIRSTPGGHLTQPGVTLARRVGETLGPFERVVTSTLPRAYETAIAMGFAVDEQVGLISTNGVEVEALLPAPQPFEAYGRSFIHGGPVTVYGKKLVRFYSGLVAHLTEERSVLVVNHSGVIEIGAVACLPDADHAVWGEALDHCEGVRLYWEDRRCVNAKVLRV